MWNQLIFISLSSKNSSSCSVTSNTSSSYTVASCLINLKMLQEQEPWVAVSLCVSVLSHHPWVSHIVRSKVKWGPACLDMSNFISCIHKPLVWLLRLGAEERKRFKQGLDWENKSSFEVLSWGYLTSPHSHTGVGCNDTIVSRWRW